MLCSTFPKIFLQTDSLSLPVPSRAPCCSSRKGEMNYQCWPIHLDSVPLFILQTFFTCVQSLNLFIQHPQCLKFLIFLTLYWLCCFLKKNTKYVLYILVALSKLLSQRLGTTGRQELFLWERIIFHHLCCSHLQRMSKGTGEKENCEWQIHSKNLFLNKQSHLLYFIELT